MELEEIKRIYGVNKIDGANQTWISMVLKEADTNNNGSVSFEEFKTLIYRFCSHDEVESVNEQAAYDSI